MKPARILIIEDDDLQHELYQEALGENCLHRVVSISEALEYLRTELPDLVILDHILEDGEKGIDALGELKEIIHFVPVIVVSGAMEVSDQLRALQGPRRAHYCLTKPVDLDELQRTVATALQECGEQEIIGQLKALERTRRIDGPEFVGRSVERVAREHKLRQLLSESAEKPNISALARQFRVARRTITRDIRELVRRGELPEHLLSPSDDDPSEN